MVWLPTGGGPQLLPRVAWASAFFSQDDAGAWISGAQPGRSRVSQATFQGQQLTCALLAGLSSPGLAEASMVTALRFQAPLDFGWHSRPLAPYALGGGGVVQTASENRSQTLGYTAL